MGTIHDRILSLDISSKTGYAFIKSSLSNFELEAYGKIDRISCPDTPYPGSFVDWAYLCFNKIVDLIRKFNPTILVIEETSGNSKSSHSQKILEYIHFLVAKFIQDNNMKSVYVMSGQWRVETDCKMTKEESNHNKEVKKYKLTNKTKVAYDKDGKRIGKLTRKHINIRRANEIFSEFLTTPLRKKDEDVADALLLGISYHLRKMRNNKNG